MQYNVNVLFCWVGFFPCLYSLSDKQSDLCVESMWWEDEGLCQMFQTPLGHSFAQYTSMWAIISVSSELYIVSDELSSLVRSSD